jgi:two-component system, chemotaxis family, sensor kinase Cph1
VASRAFPIPAFGQADLSNCEREQIHLAGSIQPHGALLVVREPDHAVVQASANAASFLRLEEDTVLGRSLDQLDGDLEDRIRPHLGKPLDEIPIAVRCRMGRPAAHFDGLVHRLRDGGALVVELERAGPPVDLSRHAERALQTILACSSLRSLADEAARVFKDLTG